MVTVLAVGGVLLAAMIAASGYAAVTLPASARIPLHFGSHERLLLVSKRTGLLVWPAAGAVVYGVLGGCVVLGFQAGALVLARGGGRVARKD